MIIIDLRTSWWVEFPPSSKAAPPSPRSSVASGTANQRLSAPSGPSAISRPHHRRQRSDALFSRRGRIVLRTASEFLLNMCFIHSCSCMAVLPCGCFEDLCYPRVRGVTSRRGLGDGWPGRRAWGILVKKYIFIHITKFQSGVKIKGFLSFIFENNITI